MSPAQDGRSAARFRITGGSDASSRPTRPRPYPLNWPCLYRIRHACPLFSPSVPSYHNHGPSIRFSSTHAIPTLSLIFDSCLIILHGGHLPRHLRCMERRFYVYPSSEGVRPGARFTRLGSVPSHWHLVERALLSTLAYVSSLSISVWTYSLH